MAVEKFRTAINGFNRSDVAEYLEGRTIAFEKEKKQLKRQLELTQKELAELQQKYAELEQSKPTVIPADEAQAETMELEAYRLAAETQRNAQKQADKLCGQVNGVLKETLAQWDGSAEKLTAIFQTLEKDLEAMKECFAQAQGELENQRQNLTAIGTMSTKG